MVSPLIGAFANNILLLESASSTAIKLASVPWAFISTPSCFKVAFKTTSFEIGFLKPIL